MQQEESPHAYVTVEGPVTIGQATRDIRVSIATRYLGDEVGNADVDSTPGDDSTLVQLTTERWRTSDFARL